MQNNTYGMIQYSLMFPAPGAEHALQSALYFKTVTFNGIPSFSLHSIESRKYKSLVKSMSVAPGAENPRGSCTISYVDMIIPVKSI